MMVEITVRETGHTPDRRTITFVDSFEIVSSDGRTLFYARLNAEGVLEVSTGGQIVQHGDRKLDSQLAVRPVGPSSVTVRRDDYEG